MYEAAPVILTPAATGPAPLGLSSTGDPRMNAPWTAMGMPAISIPMPVSSGLPLGLQLTADHGQDARVLRTALRVQSMLGSGPGGSPGLGRLWQRLGSHMMMCGVVAVEAGTFAPEAGSQRGIQN